jgi:hypothetical protein
VDTLTIICARNDKVKDIDDNNYNILSIPAIPPKKQPILPDTFEDNDDEDDNNDADNNDDDSSKDDSTHGGNQGAQEEAETGKPGENQTEGHNQGVS